MTLRRARLCDDAEKTRAGFDLHEKSHLSTVAACRRRTAFCFRWDKNHSFFSLTARFLSKFRSRPFRRFVTFPFGYLKTRVIGVRSDWSRWWSSRENQ